MRHFRLRHSTVVARALERLNEHEDVRLLFARLLEGNAVPSVPFVFLPDHKAGSRNVERGIRQHIQDVLVECAGNKNQAANLLSVSRTTNYRSLT